jgi:hypothetical protein
MQRLLYRKTIKGQNLNRNQERGWTPRDSLDKKKKENRRNKQDGEEAEYRGSYESHNKTRK